MRFTENIQMKCEKCKGLEECETYGYIAVEKELDGRIYEVYQKCTKREKYETELRYQKALRTSGIPKEYMNKTFDNYDAGKNKEAVQKIREYIERRLWREGRGLIIVGPVGTGKTHLASAIVHELAKQDIFVLFVFVPDFLDEIRETYDEEYDEEEDKFELAKNARVLVLDDLGTERITEWTKEKITQLINYRYNNILPTIITTNLIGKELIDRIGERAYSRLVGVCEIIPIVGDDWRVRNVSKRKN